MKTKAMHSPFPPVFVKMADDTRHILFGFDRDSIEEDHFYYVPTRELTNQVGVSHWLRHLSEKIWFTPPVKEEFLKLTNP
jgi:hypothetical protein